MKHFTIKSHLILFTGILGLACSSRHFVPQGQATYTEFQIDSQLTEDPGYVRLTAPYRAQLEAEMNRVVGHSDVALTKPIGEPETLLGNFFTDAMLAEGRKYAPDAQLAFGTKGGLRIELPKGAITIGNLFELMPFENELVLLELSGESILQMAEFIATTGGQPVSGLRMKIDNGKATDVTVDGQPVDPARTYQLITYDYLANGGDNTRGLGNPISRTNIGQKVREALITYVSEKEKAGEHLNAQLDGRIISNK